jgi:hypothetical protein
MKDNGIALRVTISDPQKHGEGTGAFINYLVSTKVNNHSVLNAIN